VTEWEQWMHHLRELTASAAAALERGVEPPPGAAGIPSVEPVIPPGAPTGPVLHRGAVLGQPGIEEPGRALRVNRFPTSVFAQEGQTDIVAANTPVYDAPFQPPTIGTLIWAAQWSAAVSAQWSADGGETWLTLGTAPANQWQEWRWVVMPGDRVLVSASGPVSLGACRLIFVPDVV